MIAEFLPSEGIMKACLPGPRFGADGLRELLGAQGDGALLCTALKPMGTSAEDLAEMAYLLARGGIDIVKDDHGLANQPYAPWAERVRLCAAAVARANSETGKNVLYAPCLNAPTGELLERAYAAKNLGAGAVLMLPGITGLDTVRALAADAAFALPIVAHPALLGSQLGGGKKDLVRGFTHEVLLGLMMRLIGCDATIFPNFGGRFGFSVEECKAIARGCTRPLPGGVPACVPSPGGGMTLERVKPTRELYGADVLLLIGGALLSHSPDLEENARHFYALAGRPNFKPHGPRSAPGSAPPRLVAGQESEAPGDDPEAADRGQHSKLYRRDTADFTWSGVPRTAYKQDGGGFAGVSRTELLGTRGEQSPFHVRYFEVSPGGYSSLERHQHHHGVVVVRGRGVVQLNSCARPIAFGDVVFTGANEPHQFRCPAGAAGPLGFICVVAADRDRPVPVTPAQLLALCPRRPPYADELLSQSVAGSADEGGACEWRPKSKR